VGLLTRARIEANRLKEIEEAIVSVVPGTETNQKLYEEKDFTVYATRDAEGQVTGYAIYTAGTGFQDKIVIMFGTDAAIQKIFRLTILDQKETPGLGAKITDEEAFLKYWENKDCSQPLALRKPPVALEELSSSEVNVITGATISSEAVLNTVNDSLAKLRSLIQDGTIQIEGNNGQ
jgi:RnfABCDGE-type electron transport complex G subunit